MTTTVAVLPDRQRPTRPGRTGVDAWRRSVVLAEVAPAPESFVDEELGIAGPELCFFGECERCTERVGVTPSGDPP
jgi:hypothetical protein